MLEGVVGVKDRRLESVGEVWELVSLSNILSESVLTKGELSPQEF